MTYSHVMPCPCCGERVDMSIEATVSGRYRRATRLDPEECPEVEIESVKTPTGVDITDMLSGEQMEEVKENVLEEYSDRSCAEREAHDEAVAEERRHARRMGRYY